MPPARPATPKPPLHLGSVRPALPPAAPSGGGAEAAGQSGDVCKMQGGAEGGISVKAVGLLLNQPFPFSLTPVYICVKSFYDVYLLSLSPLLDLLTAATILSRSKLALQCLEQRADPLPQLPWTFLE